jgi:NitT/TauT family transport system ATP-binding protein
MGNDRQATGDVHVSIERVSMVYGNSRDSLTALDGVDLEVGRGEFVSVIGPSGCGKSTLLRIVGGLQEPTAGHVRIDGLAPGAAQSAKEIGVVFQDPSLLPWRSVGANVRLPLQVNRGRPGEDAAALIDLVGLRRFEGYYPHQLSGGMQQRAALARALVTAPALLLMDEPFGALDEITRAAMRFELLRIWGAASARPKTVIFVTHSIPEAVLLSDRVVVMSGQPGRVLGVVRVDLPRPRTESMEFEPPFGECAALLRAMLRPAVAV